MSTVIKESSCITWEVHLKSPDEDPIYFGVWCTAARFGSKSLATEFVCAVLGHPFVGSRIYACHFVWTSDNKVHTVRDLIREDLQDKDAFYTSFLRSDSGDIYDKRIDWAAV